jgi:GT2 family glycosyltransferase
MKIYTDLENHQVNCTKIAVLITCHNRREKTLACLEALFLSNLQVGMSVHVILVDDGSTDGTSEAVQSRFPGVEVILGNGSLFWNRGMHRAFSRAMAIGFDAYLWLNDDTVLFPDAIALLSSTATDLRNQLQIPVMVVGSTQDDTGNLTYGGSVAVNRIRRFQYRKVWDAQIPVECEVINGNCVLILNEIVNVVGNIDFQFEHAMGDTDYALRVRAAGMHIFVAPGFVGKCEINPVADTFSDKNLNFLSRWRHMTSRKGLPLKSWYRFTRRHGGAFWFLYFIWPYIKIVI